MSQASWTLRRALKRPGWGRHELVDAVLSLLRLAWGEDEKRFTLAIALMLLQSAALPLLAGVLGLLTDLAIQGDVTGATGAAVAAGFLVVTALTAGHFAHILYFELGDHLALRLQRQLIAITNGSAGLEHHERPDYADKLQVLRQEVVRTGPRAVEIVVSCIGLALAVLITGVQLGSLNAWLLLLPVASVPSLACGRRAEKLLARARETSAPATRLARHFLQLVADPATAKEVRVCGLVEEIRSRHAQTWDRASSTFSAPEVRAAALRIAGQLVFALAYVSAILLIVWNAASGRHSAGDVVLTIVLAAQVNQQVTTVVSLHQELQRITTTLKDIRWAETIVARSAAVAENAVVPAVVARGISFENVSFAYPGASKSVLEEVNLQLPAGSTFALVGENGAGKTTLLKLLCGFYEPSKGHIALDGIDVRRFSLGAWRERIAAGFQDFVRFEFLARETVGLGDLTNIERAEAVQGALERARSEDIVQQLEHGLETLLGRSNVRGTELSGGQWQKLALGRAMMREAPLILILDEPTSALDARAEHTLFEQYAKSAKRVAQRVGAITILVSHRFSTVQMADRIIVVSGKGVREVGTHDELLGRGGLYAELYSLQASAYQ